MLGYICSCFLHTLDRLVRGYKLSRFCTLPRKSRRFLAREQKLVYSSLKVKFMNTYLLSLQRCGHSIAFFFLDFNRTLWKYCSLRVEQTSWFYTCRSNVQFVVLLCEHNKDYFFNRPQVCCLFLARKLLLIPYFIRWIPIKLGEYINNCECK